MKRVFAVTASLLLLAACAGFDHGTRYDCGAGYALSVVYDGDTAEVTRPGYLHVHLDRLRSGSGARYGADGYEAWEHQGELRWTEPGKAALTCRR